MAHDAKFISSSFGGGWLIPETPSANAAGEDYFREPPAPMLALAGAPDGWIVEPADVEDVARFCNARRLVVEVD